MSRHTPGPWVIDSYCNIKTPNGETLLVNGVSLPCGFFKKESESFANTKLIAAAPELLEALIDCRRVLELANFTEELSVVYAAIAKATGETT